MVGIRHIAMFLAVVHLLEQIDSQVISQPSSNVMDGRQGCRYEFTASIQDATLIGWFHWTGTWITQNDTGSNHLYPEISNTSDGSAMFARLVVDQPVDVMRTWFMLMALQDGLTPVQHIFTLAILPGTLPISASVSGGVQRTRNVSLDSYTVGESFPLECVVEACRSFDQLTVAWISPEGTIMEEYEVKFTGDGPQSFIHNLPLSENTQIGVYQCRVWTSLRDVNYNTTSTLELQGELSTSPPTTVNQSSPGTQGTIPTSDSTHHIRAWSCLLWMCAVIALLCTGTCLCH